MQKIDGKEIARNLREQIKAEVALFAAGFGGARPGLAAIRVGADPASEIYVRNKRKACEEAGMYSEEYPLPASTPQADLLALIDRLNRDRKIHGILVQLPLPAHIEERAILDAVVPEKDVDGFHYVNAGRLLANQPGFVPCTPLGILALLRATETPIAGADAVVVGRSDIVGKPAALLLLHQHATVTLCHSKTKDLAGICRRADILVAAVGRPHFITGEMVKEGAVVIDVGINRLDSGKMVGDVDFDAAALRARAITPVPGGVGPMTIAMLLANTLRAAQWTKP
jgi:methylenetetrahydrofolate dehydrogenase (NADP+)/methenyltetrahydrofolate cyclohydrolase